MDKRLGVIQVDEIIAHILHLFSAGVKVALEIACMAVDAGIYTRAHFLKLDMRVII